MEHTVISTKIKHKVDISFRRRAVKDFHLNKYAYLMGLPIIIYYLVFHYLPMAGLVLAFKNYVPNKGIWDSSWVGLKHFVDFFSTYQALRVIKNTFLINFYDILFGFPAPILFALLINEVYNNTYKRFIQTVSYLPHFISIVVVCGIIVDFCSSNGAVNAIISLFGGKSTNLLQSSQYFRTIYVASDIWQRLGWNSIIYLAALSAINTSLYEAALIDGANRFKQVIYVTLPGLVPTIIMMLILRLGQIMSVGFEKIILLYNPLTYETADVISTFVYRRGIIETDFSYATAVGIVNSVVNLIVLITANYFSKQFVKESLW